MRAVSAASPEEQDKWRKAFLAKNPRWRKKPEPKKNQVHQSTGPSRRGPATRGQQQSRGRSRGDGKKRSGGLLADDQVL